MRRDSVDHTTMRDMNLALILNTLRRRAPLSRSGLATRTGLNKATVSSIVKELLQRDFIREIGLDNSSADVGRPATNLAMNPDAGYIIGAEVGVDFLSVIVANFAFRVISRRHESTVKLRNQQAVLDRLLFLLKESYEQIVQTGRPIFGIGLGVPGLVDVSSGVLLYAPNLGWRDVPLGQLLEAEFDVPVYVANEANLAALGETYFGAGRNNNYILYVSSGVGIGTGIVIDGRLVEGATGFAGEAGHMTVDRNGLACNCGNQGCWETVAGQRALFQRVRESVEKGEASWLAEVIAGDWNKLTMPLIVEAAERGDPVACRALEETGEWLGIGIANLMNILNPQLVLFGGPLSLAKEFLMPVIEETVARRAWPWVQERADIILAAHGEDAPVMGSVAMVFREVLDKPRLWLNNNKA